MDTTPRGGRPALPDDQRRAAVVSARLTPGEVAWLDELRGSASRGEYLRTLVRAEHRRASQRASRIRRAEANQ